MAYVNMTKDFSEVKKTISGIGRTKRQIFAFATAAAAGVPIFLLCRPYMDITYAVMALALCAAPPCFLILYKKNGMYMERHIKYLYETHYIRNTERPYRSDNLYQMLLEEKNLETEVKAILNKEKKKEEPAGTGQTKQRMQEIKAGRKKIIIPVTGKIDRATKKELEKMVRKAKIKGKIPESAQDTIPYRIPYEDGIFESDRGYYTQTIAFDDITYQLLDN